MSGILVYLPGCETADAKELVARGLGDLLDPIVDLIPTQVRNGPDGGHGVLVTFCGFGVTDTPRSVDSATQQWHEAPPNGDLPKGRYWLGYVKGARPLPDDLRRRDVCDGMPVVLKDGRQWIVPIADYLPKRLTIDPDTGKETRAVAERHREFVAWANALYEYFLSDGFAAMLKKELVVNIPNALSGVAMALGKNYRVNRDVIDLLELVEDYEAFEVVKVAVGLAGALRAVDEKKNMEPSSHLPFANSMPSCTPAGSNVQTTELPSTT